MSVLGKFFSWLIGKSPPPNPKELRKQLRILDRRLQRYESEIQGKKRRAITSLRRSIRENDLEIAKEKARHVIMYDRDQIMIMRLRSRIERLLMLLERGLIMDDIMKSAKAIGPIIAKIASSLSDIELQKIFVEIGQASEKLQIGSELLEEGIETATEETDIDEAADQLVSRLMDQEGISVPTKEKKVKEKVSEEEIERILKEVAGEES
ncbi:MAG: hypothetical protein ACP6IQ_09525 [Candidatus Njordarchaeia archaeon]|nr:hypothetical protein [Candidatus Korarchaeota archaeon]